MSEAFTSFRRCLQLDFECFTILAQGGPGLQVQNRKGDCEWHRLGVKSWLSVRAERSYHPRHIRHQHW